MSASINSRVVLFLSICISCLFLTVSSAVADDDDRWSDVFHSAETVQLDAPILDMVEYEGDAVACGRFTRAGNTVLNGVARWNGSEWAPLGAGLTGPETTSGVLALAVYQGVLHAGAHAWDGEAWTNVLQTDQVVRSLAVHDGRLIAGGDFTVSRGVPVDRLLAWDGASVEPVGGGVDDDVLTVYSDGEDLIVGGRFVTAGDVPVGRLAAWDGEVWNDFSGGVDGVLEGCCYDTYYPITHPPRVEAVGVYDGDLYVGGMFSSAGGVDAVSLARWDGAAWHALPGEDLYGGEITDLGMTPLYHPPRVVSLLVRDDELLVGGLLHTRIPGSTPGLARWDGFEWLDAWNGLMGSSDYVIVESLLNFGVELIVGGSFSTVDDQDIRCGAIWDGATWKPMSGDRWWGLNGPALDVIEFDGRLVVGGGFSEAGWMPCSNVASFDGESWAPMGAGVGRDGLGWIRSLIEFDGDLIACGSFDEAGGLPACGVARWDGESWLPMGGNLNLHEVSTLCVHQGELYAAGGFMSLPFPFGFKDAEISDAPGVFRWTGSEWDRVLGASGTLIVRVVALASYGDKLYVGGRFYGMNGLTVRNLVSWDGETVEPVGNGNWGSSVRSLKAWNGELYVGGAFAMALGSAGDNLAIWDGSTWRESDGGFGGLMGDYGVYDLDSLDGEKLMVSGRFTTAGGIEAWNVAVGSGDSWHRLGSGAGPTVANVCSYNGDLYVAGNITVAGGHASMGIGRWLDALVPLQLFDFAALRRDREIVLRWRMGSEDGLTGYRIDRTGEAGTRTVANLSAAREGEYEIIDVAAGPGEFVYTLSGVLAGGAVRILGEAVVAERDTPTMSQLLSVRPNPFNPSTVIEYELVDPGEATISIHDARGRRVRVLVTGERPAGKGQVEWNGLDDQGRGLASGVYVLRLNAGGTHSTMRAVLMR